MLLLLSCASWPLIVMLASVKVCSSCQALTDLSWPIFSGLSAASLSLIPGLTALQHLTLHGHHTTQGSLAITALDFTEMVISLKTLRRSVHAQETLYQRCVVFVCDRTVSWQLPDTELAVSGMVVAGSDAICVSAVGSRAMCASAAIGSASKCQRLPS
jgi:hypothetical protein